MQAATTHPISRFRQARRGGWLPAAVVIALLAAACSDDGGGAADTTTTSTSTTLASTTSSTTTSSFPSTTTSASSTTSTTTTAPQPVADTVFAVIDGMVAGEWDGTAWVNTKGDGPLPEIEGAALRTVDGSPAEVAAAPVQVCFPESGQSLIDIDETPGLRVSGSHVLQPRDVEEIGAAAEHTEAVRAVLDSRGVAADVPVVISRVLRFDVEGDGVDEVLIEANNVPEFVYETSTGHYSVLILRRVLDDEVVENFTLHADVADTETGGIYMLRFDLVDPADVNGDNVFELAAAWSYYEGGGVSLFSLDQVPEELLLAGCGL